MEREIAEYVKQKKRISYMIFIATFQMFVLNIVYFFSVLWYTNLMNI